MPKIVKYREFIPLNEWTGVVTYLQTEIRTFLKFIRGERCISLETGVELIVMESSANHIIAQFETRKSIGKRPNFVDFFYTKKNFGLVCDNFILHNAIVTMYNEYAGMVELEINYDFFTMRDKFKFSKQKLTLLKELYSSLDLDSKNIAFLE